jgi:hypothetical protein
MTPDEQKHISFLMDYYGVGFDDIAEMCLSLNNMALKRFYDLTLAGYEYKDGKMIEPVYLDVEHFGLAID